MKEYIKVINKDKKIWIFPCKNIRTALCLYQPSSKKGKILKAILPWFVLVPCIPKKLYKMVGIEKTKQVLSDNLINFLGNLFPNENNVQFSTFMGTPGIHKKITVQISSDTRILGYCKVTENKEIYKLFKNEQIVLNELEAKGIKNIPKCIFCGNIDDRMFVFVQSTIKTLHSYTHDSIGKMEISFIRDLNDLTKLEMAFEKTDFYYSIEILQNHLNVLEVNGFSINALKKSIDNVIQYYHKETTFSAFHRDFTPWNSFIERNKLFVFDFEYASLTYPAYLDAIHYLVQNDIYKRMSALDIYQSYKNECKSGVFKNLFTFPTIALEAYILDIISLYISREPEIKEKSEIKNLLSIWIEILEYAIKEPCDVLC